MFTRFLRTLLVCVFLISLMPNASAQTPAVPELVFTPKSLSGDFAEVSGLAYQEDEMDVWVKPINDFTGVQIQFDLAAGLSIASGGVQYHNSLTPVQGLAANTFGVYTTKMNISTNPLKIATISFSGTGNVKINTTETYVGIYTGNEGRVDNIKVNGYDETAYNAAPYSVAANANPVFSKIEIENKDGTFVDVTSSTTTTADIKNDTPKVKVTLTDTTDHAHKVAFTNANPNTNQNISITATPGATFLVSKDTALIYTLNKLDFNTDIDIALTATDNQNGAISKTVKIKTQADPTPPDRVESAQLVYAKNSSTATDTVAKIRVKEVLDNVGVKAYYVIGDAFLKTQNIDVNNPIAALPALDATETTALKTLLTAGHYLGKLDVTNADLTYEIIPITLAKLEGETAGKTYSVDYTIGKTRMYVIAQDAAGNLSLAKTFVEMPGDTRGNAICAPGLATCTAQQMKAMPDGILEAADAIQAYRIATGDITDSGKFFDISY